MPRYSYVEALLGAETFAKVKESRILVVGAGGIGCELRESVLCFSCKSTELNSVVKNLVLVGFSNIEIVSYRLFIERCEQPQADIIPDRP